MVIVVPARKKGAAKAIRATRRNYNFGTAVIFDGRCIQAWPQEAGLCRYESATKCQRMFADEKNCAKCIRSWLLTKARKEIKKEE